ncbi:MAG: aminodeoxychorismate/anthranilate synthase component II [Lachnospiraceae bacterium]|nr:aminodeoxychorismate/anthranilate synthase component II [Lachnospiraceae bacterium]
MILLIDNYDSFSYNLYQLIGRIQPDIEVVRNDRITIDEIRQKKPELIVLSPGPGKPQDAGMCPQIVKELGGEFPILGVCLGHQVICEAYGATVSYAKKMMHGKTSDITFTKDSVLFKDMESPMKVARYHSLAAIKETMPEALNITAAADDGEIMAVEHKNYPVYGVQFHPESVLTPEGYKIIANILHK